jgi:hypothetical protein
VVSDGAEEYLGVDAAPFLADRHAILAAQTLPGVPGPNPLRHKADWVPVDGDSYPHAVQTRRFCCITYLLEDRLGQLCANCPHLSVEDRATLSRIRHGRPAGAAGTAEERRS